MSRAPRPSAPPAKLSGFPSGSDAYSDLLRDTRRLRREQAQLRELWVSRLSDDRREALFELEILLKGLACFANPRNHPGAPKRTALVAQDYGPALALGASGVERVVSLCQNHGKPRGSVGRPVVAAVRPRIPRLLQFNGSTTAPSSRLPTRRCLHLGVDCTRGSRSSRPTTPHTRRCGG